MSKKYTFEMVVVKPTGKGGKPLKPKPIKPIKPVQKSGGGMNDNKPKNPKPKVIPLMPEGVFYKGKAKDYPGIKELIKRKNKKAYGGELKGGQKELDKNKDGKISGEDFAMMKQKPKKAALGMMMLKKAMENSDTARKRASVMGIPGYAASKQFKSKGGEMKQGYGAARQKGQGLQDENLIPGKSMDYYKDLI